MLATTGQWVQRQNYDMTKTTSMLSVRLATITSQVNAIDYRINLIKKIGIEHVEALEGPQEPKRYRHEEILAIKAKYKLLTKELTIKLEGTA